MDINEILTFLFFIIELVGSIIFLIVIITAEIERKKLYKKINKELDSITTLEISKIEKEK